MTAAAERGTTTVSQRAVRRIAERAATEARAVRVVGSAASVRGTSAEVSLRLTLPYPAPLADTVRDVQSHVTERTRRLTGLDVPLTRIGVTSLTPSATSAVPAREALPVATGLRTPRRWWSTRGVPVALMAWAAAVSCGALAFDLFRVHLADRPAGAWRTGAVQWLSDHGPGDPAVVAGGALIALAGVWMILLALAPGRRHQWTVGTPAAGVTVAVDRSATANLVRDAVAAVDGVASARVRARRRRVTVRAALAFGDREAARAAVTAAARDALTASRLRRTPRLHVRVVPEPLWRPPHPRPPETPRHDAARAPQQGAAPAPSAARFGGAW
ncbi:DUF6286 domain-containing Asp23/Gls24 family envelope stress response protein [Streptomyces panaciradicis]|uniref:DUF6286 domain-containing Asp23/Gls24 family envelope stress response protein n=1 Tax=Streptomyces panaciradicis TaxID=1470261 RepID=UPI00201CCC95|nr:DUF6286 domain-containing protein [Streptomyces panaciradicis]MCL6675261.1 alkaline shock response membrane anchor protein AmaP [Streptomyces panaciradicis]